MSKEKHLQDIKELTSIKVVDICKKLSINEKNMYNMTTTEANIKLVKDTLIQELEECIKKIKD